MKKNEIRKLYKKKRQELSVLEINSLSKKICDKLFEEVLSPHLKYLHVFIPIEAKQEVNTWLIINEIENGNPNINLVVSKSNFDDGSLKHYLYNSKMEFETNVYGIKEPLDGVIIKETMLDAVIVPLLAFDRNGQRVGYGKGFYDRFLESCKPDVLKVGVSFFDFCDEIEDTNIGDIPLNWCVTPNTVYKFI